MRRIIVQVILQRQFSAAMSCIIEGCPFRHARGRRDGYCCNACKTKGSMHTPNCSGYGHKVLQEGRKHRQSDASMACHRERPYFRQTPYGYDHEMQQTPAAYGRSGASHLSEGSSSSTHNVAFSIPDNWACKRGDIAAFVDWYMRYMDPARQVMRDSTKEKWADLEKKVAFVNKERPLAIYVRAANSMAAELGHAAINVHYRGLWAKSHLYNSEDVTGVHFIVQAILVSQELTPQLLGEACRNIELDNLDKFTFECSHGTHRSCGCAVLLAMLVYHKAHIIFSTHRTRQAARDEGMVENVS